jgi:hypothetical protein
VTLAVDALAAMMLSRVRANVLDLNQNARPTGFQEDLTRACAAGIVQIITTSAVGVGGIGGPAASPNIGISGLDGDAMTSAADGKMSGLTGHDVGFAFEAVASGILGSAATYLAANTTVLSASGFGGHATSITGWSSDDLKAAILQAFPADARRQVGSSPAGEFFVESIAVGFTQDVQSSGVPAFIPESSGSPTGAVVVGFS